MAIVVSNVSELELLDKMISDALSSNENYILKLHSNNYTADSAAVASSFVECTWSGYTAKTLVRTSWAASVTNGSGKAETSYATQSWTAAGSGVVEGYYCTGSVSGTLLWSEKLVQKNLAVSDILNLTPKFCLSSE